MQPGEMDQVVTLRSQTTTKDRFGQHVTHPVVANVAAKVSPLQGREFYAAAATLSPASMKVEIWYRPDVLATWRLDWMGRHYEIVAEPIDVDAQHATLELMCRGVVPSTVT